MQKIKLFSKLFSLILLVFLSACTQTQSLNQTAIPNNTPQTTSTPYSERQKSFDEIIALLDQKTIQSYDLAYHKLREMYTSEEYYHDQDVTELLFFTSAITNVLEGSETGTEAWQFLSPYYFGIYNQQIKNTVLQHITLIQWKTKYSTVATMIAPEPIASIGMTAEQVINIMGNPTDINRTTTANSIREQWVYRNGRYVYFEDGIVIAIQE